MIVGILCGLALVPTALANLTVQTVGGYGPYQRGNGGEFTLLPNFDASSYDSFASDFVQAGTFQTFCVETGEYIYPNSSYDITFSDHSERTGNHLTLGAAQLYSQFASGTLSGYSRSDADIMALQAAIWYYMGVGSNPDNKFSKIANGLAQVDAGYDGVYVMNLWAPGQVGTASGARQDQLFYRVPDGGTTVMLLGMSFFGVAAFRRKLQHS